MPLLVAYLKEIGGGNLTRFALWDFTQADLAELYEQDIRTLFYTLGPMTERRRGGKTAMVFSRKVDFGVGRMIEAIAEAMELPVRFRSFWDFDAAEGWLEEENGSWFDEDLQVKGKTG